jgi:CRP-like cAMP-binding protein
VQLLELTRPDFEALLQRQPTLAFEMVRMMSLRLSVSHDASMRDVGRQLSQAYHDLQAAQAKLIEQEKFERDLALARDIQERMLPRTLPYLDGCEFGARMVPARIVGGDFFDFIPLSAETLGVVVADVCGKGMPAALYMALCRGLLRAEVSQPGADDIDHWQPAGAEMPRLSKPPTADSGPGATNEIPEVQPAPACQTTNT